RLERDRVEARHLREDLLQPPHQLERALSAVLLLQRMETSEPRERRESLVDPRVVLHRAGTEWVEARVHSEVPGRELGEVADELELRHLGQARRLGAAELLGALLRVRAQRQAGLPQLAQPLRPEPREIDEPAEREERLVRGDVRRGLLPPDVLLPGLQGEDIAALARGVYRLADDAPRHAP